MKYEYKIIRSDRKTLAIQITPEGLVVRAPRYMSAAEIEKNVNAHADWIDKHLPKAERTREAGRANRLTVQELNALAEQALQYIPARAAFYAPKMGVTYGRIAIRNQHTRWGSCSSKGNLNFNCLLMLAPKEVIDSVVVHELAHRKEMNHSPRFYAVVKSVFPEYDRWHGWLKAHGAELLARLPEGY